MIFASKAAACRNPLTLAPQGQKDSVKKLKCQVPGTAGLGFLVVHLFEGVQFTHDTLLRELQLLYENLAEFKRILDACA